MRALSLNKRRPTLFRFVHALHDLVADRLNVRRKPGFHLDHALVRGFGFLFAVGEFLLRSFDFLLQILLHSLEAGLNLEGSKILLFKPYTNYSKFTFTFLKLGNFPAAPIIGFLMCS